MDYETLPANGMADPGHVPDEPTNLIDIETDDLVVLDASELDDEDA